MNMNHMVTQSLQKQLNKVAIWQNKEENVIEEKLQLLNDVEQFHIPGSVHYIV